MKRLTILVMVLLVLSCTTSNVSSIDKKFNSIVASLEKQRLLAVLSKNVDGVDIPKEYLFSDIVIVLDGDLFMVYDYENLMTYKKVMTEQEKERLFNLLNKR
jgi:hypothetical protein